MTSPVDVSNCRRLAPIGLARTDGTGPTPFELVTVLVPAASAPEVPAIAPAYGGEFDGPNLAVRLTGMRDAAAALGATDLLLTRRIYHDWSYLEGTAYVCRR